MYGSLTLSAALMGAAQLVTHSSVHMLQDGLAMLLWVVGGYIFLNQTLYSKGKNLFLFGWWWGFVYFLVTCHWVAMGPYQFFGEKYSIISFIVLMLLPVCLGLFKGLFLLTYKGLNTNINSRYSPALWLLLFCFFEYCQYLVGVPLAFSSYMLNHGVLAQSSVLWGVWGLNILALSIFVVPYNLVLNYRGGFGGYKRRAIVFLLLLILIGLGGYIRIKLIEKNNLITINNSISDNKGLLVALIQPGFNHATKSSHGETRALKQSRELLEKFMIEKKVFPDLIVWPETIIKHQGRLALFSPFLHKTNFVVGGQRIESRPNRRIRRCNIYNSVYFVTARGHKHYDKQTLVPFGEYIPGARFLPVSTPMPFTSFKKGDKNVLFKIKGYNILPIVCSEFMFVSNIVKKARRLRTNIIANPVNDSFFRGTRGYYEHLAIARLTAISSNTLVLRAAVDGISACIDPAGNVHGIVAPYKKGEGIIRIASSGKSYESSMSDYPIFQTVMFILLLLLVSILSLRRYR